MRLLLVFATPLESAPLREVWSFDGVPVIGLQQVQVGDLRLDLLHTGIGMVNTGLQLGAYLAQHQPDRAIHLGIGGSLDRQLSLGQLVELKGDTYAALGADSPTGFIPLDQLGFATLQVDGRSYYARYENPHPYDHQYPLKEGLTVNCVSGEKQAIEARYAGTDAEIETMESAAFFQAMTMWKVPFWSFRAISNYIEARNRANWQIPLAVQRINQLATQLIHQLAENSKR